MATDGRIKLDLGSYTVLRIAFEPAKESKRQDAIAYGDSIIEHSCSKRLSPDARIGRHIMRNALEDSESYSK